MRSRADLQRRLLVVVGVQRAQSHREREAPGDDWPQQLQQVDLCTLAAHAQLA